MQQAKALSTWLLALSTLTPLFMQMPHVVEVLVTQDVMLEMTLCI
jgi:hypothetical protein